MNLVPRVPRPPLVPDPFRRSRIPKDLDAVTTVGAEIDPVDVGMTREQVERIWRAVQTLYRSGVHPAIALCLRRDGEVILDRAIGHARGNGPRDPRDAEKVPATPDTPFVIMSASKALTATVAHLLDARGDIHIADRVAEYIPEYAAHGKDMITIAHVLSHRAGVPNLPREALDLERIDDREFIVRTLCEARQASRPGRELAYHAISGGFILGEIVQRVCGKSIRDVLAEEILDPLGFDLCNYGVPPERVDEVARSYATGPPALPPVSTLVRRAIGVAPDEAVALANDPRFLTGIVPAGNVVATANELSRFFELLRAGGELDGVRVLDPRTIRRAVTEQSYREIDLTLGFPIRYSLGFMLGAQVLSLYGPDTEIAFGHLGYTNVIGWADPQRAVGRAADERQAGPVPGAAAAAGGHAPHRRHGPEGAGRRARRRGDARPVRLSCHSAPARLVCEACPRRAPTPIRPSARSSTSCSSSPAASSPPCCRSSCSARPRSSRSRCSPASSWARSGSSWRSSVRSWRGRSCSSGACCARRDARAADLVRFRGVSFECAPPAHRADCR